MNQPDQLPNPALNHGDNASCRREQKLYTDGRGPRPGLHFSKLAVDALHRARGMDAETVPPPGRQQQQGRARVVAAEVSKQENCAVAEKALPAPTPEKKGTTLSGAALQALRLVNKWCVLTHSCIFHQRIRVKPEQRDSPKHGLSW